MDNRIVYVISDLHIGSGELDDFDKELESNFVEFLKSCSSREIPVELIVNGDFMDFVQAYPWNRDDLRSTSIDGTPLCYTENQSLKKFNEISKAHKPIFPAISRFLKSDENNRLTIIPGNHDADFFWEEVRASFIRKICSENDNKQIYFHLEQGYIPESYPDIWIEHGHQHDPCNHFFINEKSLWSKNTPPILLDQNGDNRLLECIGTRFLNLYINKLDELYPFVDNIKPFSRFVLIFSKSILETGYGPVKVGLAVWEMMKYMANVLTHSPNDLLSRDDKSIPDTSILLLSMFNQLSYSEREKLLQDLREKGFPINIRYQDFLKSQQDTEQLALFLLQHFDLIPDFREKTEFLGMIGSGTLSLLRHSRIDETIILTSAAAEWIEKNGTGTVIMGHTHIAQDHPDGLDYVNTGCWTRYYNFDKNKSIPTWSFLKSYSYQTFPYRLNYAEILPKEKNMVFLRTFKERCR